MIGRRRTPKAPASLHTSGQAESGRYIFMALLEVEEDVDRAFVLVGLEPVSDFVVVHGEIAENLAGFCLQLGEEVLVERLIEEFAGGDGPLVAQALFGGSRQAGDHHGAKLVG